MTIAYWCVLAALFLPYLSTAFAKFQGDFGPKQNHNPREFLGALSGARQRANWAQQNGFEVTPAFAAAVVIAHLAQTSAQGTIDGIALAFVASRVLFTVCYIADWASARTLVWAFGMGCIVLLFTGIGG